MSYLPTPDRTTLTQSLVNDLFEQLFGLRHDQFDLAEGVITNPGQVRVLYLSADVLRGIYDALYYEAGDSWGIILKSCGHLWGQRIARLLEREVHHQAQRRLEQFTVAEYVALIENYFAHHGWGKLTLNLEDAAAYGIVRATLTHSLFAATLTQVEGPVDFMIAGMLQGLFERVSGCDLDCLEVASPRQNAAPASEFLLTAPHRLAALETLIENGASCADLLQQLRQL